MKRLGVVILAGLGVACTDRTAASISLAPPPLITSRSEVGLSAMALGSSGKELPDVPLSLSVAPDSVAVITQSHGLRCLTSGPAKVTAQSGSVTRSAPFRCELVERISVPDKIELVIPNAPLVPKVVPYDEHGKPLYDLPLRFTIDQPSIVAVKGHSLEPLQVGRATLRVAIGDVQASAPVIVSRKVRTEPLELRDGARFNLTLGQGKYEVQIRVRAGSKPDGVTAQWIGGGADCEDHAEAQEFETRCTIADTGSLVIVNPTTFGLGATVEGFAVVYQVP